MIQNYDILIITSSTKITSNLIKYVTKPIIIATISVGLDHISQEFFNSPYVTIINLEKSNALSVAEHIFALILSLNKRINESNTLVKKKKNKKNYIHEVPEDISKKVLGLIGVGNISQEVIKIAHIFNMRIKCYTKNPDKHNDLLNKGIEFTTLDNILSTSDIITINIPLNNETNNLISSDKIKLLKPTATFINASRAKVVDIPSLIEYADKYSTFYIGLDIDAHEYSELFNKFRNNVIVTPHIAGTTKQACDRMNIEIANRLVDFINSK